jgi:ADP-heptose:LPS heptosyltransferase
MVSKPVLQPLVLNFGGIGDMVMLTPALQLLRERYGSECVVGSSGEWAEALLRGHPHVSKVYRTGRIRKPYWSNPRQWHFCSQIRRDAFGPVYVGEYVNTDRIRRLLHRAGIEAERCLFWEDFPEEQGMHRAQRWLALASRTPKAYLSASAVPEIKPALLRDYPPYLQIQADERQDLKRWLSKRQLDGGPLILFQPGSKQLLGRGGFDAINNDRAWPIERWSGLCDQIQAEVPFARLLLIGQAPERQILAAIQRHSSSRPQVACSLPMRRLLALQEGAWAMVSIDTGPAHVSGALGTPVLVLFGGQSPDIWKPHSADSARVVTLRASSHSRTVADISLSQALEGWQVLRKSLRPWSGSDVAA